MHEEEELKRVGVLIRFEGYNSRYVIEQYSMHCPKCSGRIDQKDINISDDIVRCSTCNSSFKASDCLELKNDHHFDLNNPPNGSWIKKTSHYTEIGSHTGTTIIVFVIPFLALINWFLIRTFISADYDQIELTGTLIFVILLFLSLDFFFLYLTLLKTFGVARVRMNQIGGEVFVGFWRIGSKRKFKWEYITSISEEDAYLGFRREKGRTIVFEGQDRFSFGIRIEESNRKYLIKAIQHLIPK